MTKVTKESAAAAAKEVLDKKKQIDKIMNSQVLNIKSFPKIFNFGSRHVKNIFEDEVEITEKVDGSQFSFGKFKGEVKIRSKGQEIYFESPPKMFNLAASYVASIGDRLPEGITFHCEYLNKEKHNALTYERIPKHNFVLYGVRIGLDEFVAEYSKLQEYATMLDIDVTPLLFKGKIESIDQLKELINIESFLGGTHVEGCVVKNYVKSTLIGDVEIPLVMAKLVTEEFQEVHGKKAYGVQKIKQDISGFQLTFCTKARWEKAIQHLREADALIDEPKDIGPLVKEIERDITEEEKDYICNWLWHHFRKDFMRAAIRGFPQYYKERLLGSVEIKEEKDETKDE